LRSVEIALWTFVISSGLGQFSDGEVSLAMLALSLFVPLLFIPVDRRLNSWYITLKARNAAISSQINNHVPPARFPLYDPTMIFVEWEPPSGYRDPNYIIFYGLQLGLSVIIIGFSAHQCA
jgi:hypothetical protein